MNFSASIKEEIFRKPIKERCCKKAFLAGLIRGSGEIYSDGDSLGFDFTLSDEEFIGVISEYFRILYGYDITEISVSEDRLNKRDKVVISIRGEKAVEVLKDIGVLIDEGKSLVVNMKFYGALTAKECCLRSFIKGLFITSGNCTVPSSSGSANTRYHLEIAFSHSAPAMDTTAVLDKNGVSAKITRRKDKFVMYIKSGEEIKNFFAFIGAATAALKLTDLLAGGELKNVINRRTNCDLGNVIRQVDAYEKHIRAIDKIEKTVGLKFLKKDLEETACARKDSPDDTLGDLAQKLGISKSCLNHRLRKIVSIAEEL